MDSTERWTIGERGENGRINRRAKYYMGTVAVVKVFIAATIWPIIVTGP